MKHLFHKDCTKSLIKHGVDTTWLPHSAPHQLHMRGRCGWKSVKSSIYKAGVEVIGTSSVIYTLFHIFTGIKEPRAGERASSGSVLLYKKAPVSWTGHPLLHKQQEGPKPDCHRLISRLESHNLVLGGSVRRQAKKGCWRASPKVSRLAGSYSSMLSIRSKSWWCSSASEVRYRWWRAGRR